MYKICYNNTIWNTHHSPISGIPYEGNYRSIQRISPEVRPIFWYASSSRGHSAESLHQIWMSSSFTMCWRVDFILSMP
ncbi:MAG: hypothetical protein Greene041662_959 [Candidatus Peregrinibacteria bacterium Greene0416_62]|nr:MAG: hypothetical protein Greene041662_959 [Candidatus Peregrinibacteria bacterium Greene0416_62]TSD00207.1 MAG: hypothetical protein Greene101449_293 [Candidatus Peregrinibacteria bacterium Greene1014_49]